MNFLDLIKENVLLGDGATGTFLQSRGLEPGGCPELMNALILFLLTHLEGHHSC